MGKEENKKQIENQGKKMKERGKRKIEGEIPASFPIPTPFVGLELSNFW